MPQEPAGENQSDAELSDALKREIEEAADRAEAGGEVLSLEAAAERLLLEQGDSPSPSKEDEYLELLRRTKADFANYRKRVDQERDEARRQLTGDVILKLLAVVDDLERALANTPAELSDSEWAKGVGLIHQRLQTLLEGEGVVKIEAEGQRFDPRRHEAVHQQESDDTPEGSVLSVYRAGYALGERVLRPAQVVVAKAGADPAAQEEQRSHQGQSPGRTDDEGQEDG